MRTFRLLAVLAGITSLLLGLRIFGRSYSITRWPVAPGRVIHSGVTEAGSGRYAPVVEYQFILAGKTYRGAGIRYPGGAVPDSHSFTFPSRAKAESLVAIYPEGRELIVGYNPVDPSESVLQPRLVRWPLALVFAGIVAIGAGILAGRRRD